MTALSTLPPNLRTYLYDFVVRARRAALVRGIGVAAARFAGWMILACLADRFLHFPQSVRFALFLAGAGLALAAAMRPLISMRRRVDWVSAAWQVERHNPAFGQRLVTVTSRFLGAADYRGSDEILLRLAREVDLELAADRTAMRPPLRIVLAPWVIVALEVLLVVALLRVPDLGFGRLAERFLVPLADLPPVTTTELILSPGDADVIQSRPLTIEVRAARLGDSPVMLYLGDGVHEWWRSAMMPAGSGRFTFTVASVDKDLRYHVSGGDATTPDYSIRALRKPAVSQFTVRYEYPAYTRLPTLTVTNTDGRIEAPAGTRVLLTITATEPLQSALLTIGKDKILMDRTADPHVRRAELVVRGETRYDLDLISSRDVAGSGPSSTMYLRAVPDLPPQVRLSRGGDSLRLNPRDILPLSYEALDDYGVRSVAVKVQVNSKAAMQIPVPLWGDPRHRQDVFNLDLATFPLGIGDVLAVAAVATDTAGHSVSSEPLHVLVSPRSVDLDTYERIAELRSAAQLAGTLLSQFEDANRAQDEAEQQKNHQSPGYLSVTSRGDRALSAAAQTAVLLRQSLLRAITHSDSAQLSVVLADWVDAAEREGAAAEEAFRQSGAPAGMANTGRDLVRRAAEQARELQAQLRAVQDGEQAAAVLRDRENLKATEGKPPPADANARNRLNQTLQRMREDIARDARQLGLNPEAGDLDEQLRGKSSAADALVQPARPVDFAAAARDWSGQIQADARQRLGLEGRLSAAAQAEAIRRDADLIRARDLELEARAAGTIAASLRGGARPITPKTMDDFSSAVQALQHLHELRPQHQAGGKDSDELKSARQAAARARQDLLRAAGGSDAVAVASSRAVSASDRQKDAEDLAMQASAAAAGHDYRQAAAIDQSMIRRLDEKPRHESGATRQLPSSDETESAVATSDRVEHHRQVVQREMASAQSIDAIGRNQEKVASQTSGDELAGRQRAVADQIAQVAKQSSEDAPWSAGPNARDKAAAEVLAAQEQLAGMPRAIADAQSAAGRRRDAAARAATARQQAQATAPDQRAAAERAASQAQQDLKDASDRVARAADPISPRAAQAMSERLAAYLPETSASCAVLSDQLAPAFQSLGQALAGDDAGATDRAASDSRRSIESAQRELAAVQDSLVKRDPLVAAKWFARAAAESLALRPPDLGRARQRQADVSAALSRAWDQSIHRAAGERLALLPSLASVMGPSPAPPKLAGQAAAPADRFPAAREWGRLRAAEGPELNAPLHDMDPPGYEEALRLYFEALGKAQEQR